MVYKLFSAVSTVRSFVLGVIAVAFFGVLPGAAIYASTYGGCAYGQSGYNNGSCGSPAPAPVIHIGPLTLPNTGPTWLSIIGALLLAVGVGLFVWLRQRQKRARQLAGLQ